MAPLSRRLGAEFLGTLTLVLIGVGAAVFASGLPVVGIGFLGIALAFGLALMIMAYAIGGISGCHINPAVTLGLATARKFPWKDVGPYVIAQILGAIAGAGILYLVGTGSPIFDVRGGFGANGYGIRSPLGFNVYSAMLAEAVLTFLFVMVILGVTDYRRLVGFAPLAIGLALAAVHLVGIPITNMSVNPARSIGPAVFVGGWALRQLWLFLLFPLLGGVLAGVVYPLLRYAEAVEEEYRTEEVEGSAPGEMAA
jgi:aquaporin Z